MRILISLCAVFLLTACSTLTVAKVDPDDTKTSGVRFSLPRSFLQVTPKGDGTIDVSVIYLPDPDATFAAEGASYFATHTLDLQVSDGLLTVATWKEDEAAAEGYRFV